MKKNAMFILVLMFVTVSACDDDSATCNDGETTCSGDCVVLTTDVAHCGSCTNACEVDEMCVNGQCIVPCQAPLVLCEATCADLQTSTSYCGDCDTTCDNDQICVEGECVTACEGNLEYCDSGCVDLATDNDNCGSCDVPCGTDGFCLEGECQPLCMELPFERGEECLPCGQSSCCEEIVQCAPGSDCNDLITCMEVCTDNDCQNDCVTTYPQGVNDAQVFYECFNGNCEIECANGMCGSTLSYPNPEANECLSANCCASFNPCWEDADCAQCIMDPSTVGCDTNTLYDIYSTCQDTNCPFQFCGSDLGFAQIDCNVCVNTNCCSEVEACAGANGETSYECSVCLSGTGPCATPGLIDAAAALNICLSTNCSACTF
ncbi:hypothetical protein KKF84_21690 [Myxococcota bacterium]|nr:hypothetical protein [Myxococcota bacterium]MBU1537940.1 hypothetical protein [Myxococcota bacterium]